MGWAYIPAMAWEVFAAYGAASRHEATLRASGYLFISKAILKRANQEDATHFEMLYDEEHDRLGIKFWNNKVDEDEGKEGSVRELMTEKSGVAISLMPLLRYYGITKPSKKYGLAVTFPEEGMIAMSLKPLKEDDPAQ